MKSKNQLIEKKIQGVIDSIRDTKDPYNKGYIDALNQAINIINNTVHPQDIKDILSMDTFELEELGYKYEGKHNETDGLQILKKYSKNDPLVAAEHDVIYSITFEEAINNGITLEDVYKLRSMNWMGESSEQFSKFV